MRYWLVRFSHPLRGLKDALLHDFAIQFEVVVLGIIGLPAVYFLFGPFSGAEMLLLIFCWFFIIVAELQNSAIEIALDRLHPERHPEIGRSKDVAAAAVVWAAVFGLVSFICIVTGMI